MYQLKRILLRNQPVMIQLEALEQLWRLQPSVPVR